MLSFILFHSPPYPHTNSDAPVFTVSPQTQDVLPKSVVEFQVNFQPDIDNSFFGVELECYAFFKTMRSFRLVNEETFTPPWCLTMHASGNTFPPGQDTFLPKIQVHNATHRLDFPGCRVHQEVYRTIRVSNEGDTPVKFAFATSAEQLNQTDNHDFGQGFSVKPRFGLLAKNQSQLIVFKFSPAEQQVYEQTLKCFFNNSTANEYVRWEWCIVVAN